MSQTVVPTPSESPMAGSRPGIDYHPRALYILFATELWERYGFYTLLATMTLFLQDKVEGLSWERNDATAMWSNCLMFVYMTPFLGGLIADRILGYRRSILIGGIVFALGYFLLSSGSATAFYTSLVLIFIGNGFFKPNISTMVGNFYPAGSPLRDAAYNIFYMGINIGAFLAPVVAEVLRQKLGFARRSLRRVWACRWARSCSASFIGTSQRASGRSLPTTHGQPSWQRTSYPSPRRRLLKTYRRGSGFRLSWSSSRS